MRILITGGTGYLGRFLVLDAQRRGHEVTLLARHPTGVEMGPHEWLPFDLDTPPEALPPADALIHCAFDHVPGSYRGGEGDDPEGFLARNRDGSIALFQAARAAGIRRAVFLSTRAVYGPYKPGTVLTEDLPPRPDTLYGQMKWQVEQALSAMAGPGFAPVSLRATGVYGTSMKGGWHKWADLLAEFKAGAPIAPRQGTEVHGEDLASAVRTALTAQPQDVSGKAFNVSDILLDRRDMLARYATAKRVTLPLPDAAPAPNPNAMDCTALKALGWSPGGWARLDAFFAGLS